MFLFRKGQLGSSGSVAWDFSYLGIIEASPAQAGIDPEEAAIEAGAQDLPKSTKTAPSYFTQSPRIWMR